MYGSQYSYPLQTNMFGYGQGPMFGQQASLPKTGNPLADALIGIASALEIGGNIAISSIYASRGAAGAFGGGFGFSPFASPFSGGLGYSAYPQQFGGIGGGYNPYNSGLGQGWNNFGASPFV